MVLWLMLGYRVVMYDVRRRCGMFRDAERGEHRIGFRMFRRLRGHWVRRSSFYLSLFPGSRSEVEDSCNGLIEWLTSNICMPCTKWCHANHCFENPPYQKWGCWQRRAGATRILVWSLIERKSQLAADITCENEAGELN